ncbi:hypothetical protein C7Y47_00495 [Lysinibacillus sphaericus]|uniref:Uncharacterized protein n=1 Tax=Lysinibacillus sphaericus TaxID=1421 RepID=A0A544V0C0_LYSSH|nr:hypothetical protein [Lysinibacillus sp. SDF0037]TQR39552.1 hypothetical protein C7Y47_00495 [Lysinibacillus sp. SDF0037]
MGYFAWILPEHLLIFEFGIQGIATYVEKTDKVFATRSHLDIYDFRANVTSQGMDDTGLAFLLLGSSKEIIKEFTIDEIRKNRKKRSSYYGNLR